MKAGKVKLISFLSVLSIILVFIVIFITSQYISDSNRKNEEENSKYVLDEAYSYPVLPGTEQWNSFPSVLKKREACYVSEEILSKMTTSALVETVVTYPLFTDVNCFDTLEMGVEWVSQYFGGFEELKERTDAKENVIKFINFLCPEFLEMKNDEEFEKCLRDFEEKDSRFEIIHLINAKTLLTYLDSLDSSNSKENRAFSYGNTYFDIITPNGTYVTAFQGHIWSDHGKQPAVVQIENNNLEANYSSANVLYPINPSYNCHSYAWYLQNTSNDYWINGSEALKYMIDGSYSSSNPAIGRKVVYKDSNNYPGHTGIVTGFSSGTYVTSKWGYYAVFNHLLTDCPYYLDNPYTSYWKLN